MPLFKVKKDNRFYYFLTRSEAKEFIEVNKDAQIGSIIVEENRNDKLEDLIQLIKENF